MASLLEKPRAIVMDEPGTVSWFAIRMEPSTFGVFDAFPDDAARDAHLSGGPGQAMGPNTRVQFSEQSIEKIDGSADKVARVGAPSGLQTLARAEVRFDVTIPDEEIETSKRPATSPTTSSRTSPSPRC